MAIWYRLWTTLLRPRVNAQNWLQKKHLGMSTVNHSRRFPRTHTLFFRFTALAVLYCLPRTGIWSHPYKLTASLSWDYCPETRLLSWVIQRSPIFRSSEPTLQGLSSRSVNGLQPLYLTTKLAVGALLAVSQGSEPISKQLYHKILIFFTDSAGFNASVALNSPSNSSIFFGRHQRSIAFGAKCYREPHPSFDYDD